MNQGQVVVFKGRSKILSVSVGINVANDTLVSEIRADKDSASTLIASWEVTKVTDGTDGELEFNLSAATTAGIAQSIGYMDIKRLINGVDPVMLFDDPIEVIFKDPVTA